MMNIKWGEWDMRIVIIRLIVVLSTYSLYASLDKNAIDAQPESHANNPQKSISLTKIIDELPKTKNDTVHDIMVINDWCKLNLKQYCSSTPANKTKVVKILKNIVDTNRANEAEKKIQEKADHEIKKDSIAQKDAKSSEMCSCFWQCFN